MNYPALFICTQYSYDASRSPFNELSTHLGGASGRPNLIPMTDGSLVSIAGRSTSGPSAQMQSDMDVLTQSLGLVPANYGLCWYPNW